MASLVTRLQVSLFGRRVPKWACLLTAITVLYLLVRWATAPPKYGMVIYPEEKINFKTLDTKQVDGYMRAMVDYRSEYCRKLSTHYKGTQRKVSIILDFNEHQFYDLQLTLTSIVEHTPQDAYEEIVLIDDGTSSEHIKKDAVRFLGDARFSKVQAYRSSEQNGRAASRFKAASIATGEILVFIHSKVAVNTGWLAPLMDAIQANRKQLVVPHFDNLLSGHRFFPMPMKNIPAFDWTLTTKFLELDSDNEKEYLVPIPVMTGSMFAVEKKYYEEIGSYDESMGPGGGEDLEFSLRTWLCGGSIHLVPCSRVAQHNTLLPMRISRAENYQKVTELWLSNFRDLIYRQNGISFDVDQHVSDVINQRNTQLTRDLGLTCQSGNWFLENAGKYLKVPSRNWKFFGSIKSKSGYCLENSRPTESDVILVRCEPFIYRTQVIMEFTSKGHITHGGRCLEQRERTPEVVSWQPCNVALAQQLWRKQEKLIRPLKDSNLCLSHVKHEDGRVVAKLEVCDKDNRSQMWEWFKS